MFPLRNTSLWKLALVRAALFGFILSTAAELGGELYLMNKSSFASLRSLVKRAKERASRWGLQSRMLAPSRAKAENFRQTTFHDESLHATDMMQQGQAKM